MKRIVLEFDEKNRLWPSVDGQRLDGVIRASISNARDGGRVTIELDSQFCDLKIEGQK